MRIKEFIEFLQTFDEDLPICYEIYSEYAMLDKESIKVKYLCTPRPDGWVHEQRPDKESIKYLVLPGN